MQSCASCKLWVPTEMEAYKPDAQPHERRDIAAKTEMLRATHALCSWPGEHPEFWKMAPPWVRRSHVASGTLTEETDGADCPAWKPDAIGP